LKHEGWDEGEECEEDGEVDEHADEVLAERPGASVFVVAEATRSEEALIKRSTQPPTESTERHYLQRYAEQCVGDCERPAAECLRHYVAVTYTTRVHQYILN